MITFGLRPWSGDADVQSGVALLWHADFSEKGTCEFLLDYDEEEEDEEDTGKAKRKKKPWRYRWPDDFRDLVLARPLELNIQRAEKEALGGAKNQKKPAHRKTAGKVDGKRLF